MQRSESGKVICHLNWWLSSQIKDGKSWGGGGVHRVGNRVTSVGALWTGSRVGNFDVTWVTRVTHRIFDWRNKHCCLGIGRTILGGGR